jgi:hypothetical protein
MIDVTARVHVIDMLRPDSFPVLERIVGMTLELPETGSGLQRNHTMWNDWTLREERKIRTFVARSGNSTEGKKSVPSSDAQ